MRERETPITDDYLKSLNNINEAETKDFFYARTKQRLVNEQEQKEWIFPLKPIWMISMLAFLLIVNTLILTQKNVNKQHIKAASIENFAIAYDQNISYY